MDRLETGAISVPGVKVRVVESCSSTNDMLMAEGEPNVLLAAEEQTAGRGRRGQRWHAARGMGLTFSLSTRTHRPLAELAGLSLVAGVGVARALRSLGVARVALKWPNDLVVGPAKLGGILVETRGNASGAFAVIGIGLNCRADPALERRLRRRLAALEKFIAIDRNALASRVGRSLREALAAFEVAGLEPFRAEWEAMHAYAGSRMRVRLADGRVVTGVARGLDEDGGLRIENRLGVRAVRSGRVLSARPA
jgi:BirA family biotin operon repressor/biotin-[acetyl-CoA-carboxylase] ligase